jgi:hypothetical protein
MTDDKCGPAPPANDESSGFNKGDSAGEGTSLDALFGEIRQLRADQRNILGLLKQRTDSETTLPEDLKVCLSSVPKSTKTEAFPHFWQYRLPNKENLATCLQWWQAQLSKDPPSKPPDFPTRYEFLTFPHATSF